MNPEEIKEIAVDCTIRLIIIISLLAAMFVPLYIWLDSFDSSGQEVYGNITWPTPQYMPLIEVVYFDCGDCQWYIWYPTFGNRTRPYDHLGSIFYDPNSKKIVEIGIKGNCTTYDCKCEIEDFTIWYEVPEIFTGGMENQGVLFR